MQHVAPAAQPHATGQSTPRGRRAQRDGHAIAIRPMAYVSFTFDHRILDGASADQFVSSIKKQIETWR